MSPRVYEHKFDWEEARRLAATGVPHLAIARTFGVSQAAISRVLTPDRLAVDALRASTWRRSGACPDCGARASRTKLDWQHRCQKCAAIAQATTVRPDSLQCITCHEWKPDAAFNHDKKRLARRGRRKDCRACSTIAKRSWRQRTGRLS